MQAAVVAAPDGEVLGATLPGERAAALARAGAALLREGGERAVGVEVSAGDTSVFAVREGDRLIAAVAERGPASGLVLYDLRTCLRRVAEHRTQKADEAA